MRNAWLERLLDSVADRGRELLGLKTGEGGGVVDPVAGFHLANGARLERIKPFADVCAERLAAPFGVKVNYLYRPEEVAANHERFTANGEVLMSKAVARQYRRFEERLPRVSVGHATVVP